LRMSRITVAAAGRAGIGPGARNRAGCSSGVHEKRAAGSEPGYAVSPVRSCSVVPPQIPWICPVRSANARHSRRTRQVAQIALASAACSRAGPESEIGKNSSGSADRQAATDRHYPRLTSHVVQASPTCGRRSRAPLTSPPPRHRRRSAHSGSHHSVHRAGPWQHSRRCLSWHSRQ